MRQIRLLGEEWGGARLQSVQDTLLVTVEDERVSGPFSDDHHAIAFDLPSRRPLAPASSFASPVHLAELPSFGPVPVLASLTSKALVINDVRDGSVLATFPLPGAGTGDGFQEACHLAVGHFGGRDLLFLHEGGEGPYHRSVSAVGLTTGEPLPALGDDHFRYREVGECLTLRHGYLAWLGTEEVVEFWEDGFDVVDRPFVYVQRADDGARVGKVGLDEGVPEDRAVEIAHAAGCTYLAEGGDIFTLPDLEPVLPVGDPWVVVSRVTEWDGRPVAVVVREQGHPRELSGRLYHLFLDTDTPRKVALPWSLPPRVHNLAAAPDGTIVVSSAEGVHVFDVDPAEAARTDPRG